MVCSERSARTVGGMSAANQIDYIEFQATNVAASKHFFEQLFSWKLTDYGPDYTSFDSGGVLVVFYHPRLEDVRERMIELGGKITQDIFAFPGGRRFHFIEPGGNECAIWSEDPGEA